MQAQAVMKDLMKYQKSEKMRTFILIICVAMVLVSCSSLPKNRDTRNPTVLQADNIVKKAAQLEKLQAYSSALEYYQIALEKYQLTDDVKEALRTQISIARQFKKMNQKQEYLSMVDEIESNLFFQKDTDDLKSNLALLKIEDLYHTSQYDSLMKVASSIKSKNKEIILRKQTWQLLGLFETNAKYKEQKKELEENTNKAMNSYLKKKFDSVSAISFAFYTLGYVSYHNVDAKNADFKHAISLFKQAYEADLIDQNFINIATDLYYIASAYQKLNDYQNASWYFERAANIYEQLLEHENSEYARFYSIKNKHMHENKQLFIEQAQLISNKTQSDDLKNKINEWILEKE